MKRIVVVGIYALLSFGSLPAFAQQPARSWIGEAKGGLLVSFQPERKFDSSIYLDNGIGGTTVGAEGGYSWTKQGLVLAAEISSTLAYSALQSGRFVGGTSREPQRSRHRDTLLSFLLGLRTPARRTEVDLMGGVSIVVPASNRENHSGRDGTYSRGPLALTGGISVAIVTNARFAIVPSVRYSYLLGDDDISFGAGRQVLRGGLSLRYRWAQP